MSEESESEVNHSGSIFKPNFRLEWQQPFFFFLDFAESILDFAESVLVSLDIVTMFTMIV